MRMAPHRPRGVFLGLATLDLEYPVDEIPRRNQKISVSEQRVSAGGPATNAAVAFSFLGGRSVLVTAVGKHPFGAALRQDVGRFPIVLHDLARQRTAPPPVSSIMVLRGTGERSVVSANAAAFGAITAKLNPDWMSGASMVQVDGHYSALCLAGARLARSRSIPVVLDSGSWKEGMAELLPLIDIAVCSDDFLPPGCRDENDALEFLIAQDIRQVAITRGASPILYCDEGKRGKIPIERVRPIDMLGAGDIFHGAFCYYASRQGRSFRDALTMAAAVATFSCLHPGTRSWMPAFAHRQAVSGKT